MRPSALALLAAFAASPAAAQAPQVAIPLEIACRGDAPYWQLDAGRATGTLKRAGGQAKQQLELRGELSSIDGVAPPALVWRGSSTHLPAEVVVVAAREIACTAGDSPLRAATVIRLTSSSSSISSKPCFSPAAASG